MDGQKGLVALLLAASAASCSEDTGRIAPGTDTYYHGNISEGSKFGIAIGDPVPITKTLDSSLHFVSAVNCDTQIEHIAGCAKGEKFMLYDIDSTFRKGQLYLRIRADRVASLIWQSAIGRTES